MYQLQILTTKWQDSEQQWSGYWDESWETAVSRDTLEELEPFIRLAKLQISNGWRVIDPNGRRVEV